MSAIKILPACKEYIWGGNKLRNYGITSSGSNIAEAWIFSYNENGLSTDENGKILSNVLAKEDLGNKYFDFPFFPFLIKFIDANDNLSIQVHPSDDYALKNENSFGKTEMWYILEAEEGSFLYLGLNDNYSPQEVENAIKNNTICDLLNKVPVKAGDCYFVESGTIHAIGKGIVIIEIQQNSALTYRVYDYDRVDKNGNHRELHVEKALKVINFNKFNPINVKTNLLGTCKYFTVNKIESEKTISASEDAGVVITFIEGEGLIDGKPFKKGDTYFLKANKENKRHITITKTLKKTLTPYFKCPLLSFFISLTSFLFSIKYFI